MCMGVARQSSSKQAGLPGRASASFCDKPKPLAGEGEEKVVTAGEFRDRQWPPWKGMDEEVALC